MVRQYNNTIEVTPVCENVVELRNTTTDQYVYTTIEEVSGNLTYERLLILFYKLFRQQYEYKEVTVKYNAWVRKV